MHSNESIIDYLEREVLEETGIEKFHIKKILDAFRYTGDDPNYQSLVVISYWCQTDVLEIKLSDEHQEYKWVASDNALTSNLDPNLQRIILRFMSERAL